MKRNQLEEIAEKLKNEKDYTKHFNLLCEANEDAQELFFYSIENNDVSLLNMLLEIKNPENGMRLIEPQLQKNYALRYAAENGHTEVVRLLLSLKDKDDNLLDPTVDNNYPLKWATIYGHTEIVKLLLSLKDKDGNPVIDPRVNENMTLINAAEFGHIKLVRFLLSLEDKDGKPMINHSTDRNIALKLAAEKGHVKIVELFLSLKEKDFHPLETIASNIEFALKLAAKNNHEGVVRLLLSLKDKDINPIKKLVSQDQHGIIKNAAEKYDIESLLLLLAYVPNKRNIYKMQIVKYLKISGDDYDILLDKIKAFVDNPKLYNISAESILDFLMELKQKSTDKDVQKLLNCHEEYDLSLSSYDIINHVKKQKNTDIDRFKLVCKDFLGFIKGSKRLDIIFPDDIWNIILPFLGGYKKLQIERNLFKLSITTSELSSMSSFLHSKKIRDARKQKLSIGL